MHTSDTYKARYKRVYERALKVLISKYSDEYKAITEPVTRIKRQILRNNHVKEFESILMDVKCNRIQEVFGTGEITIELQETK